MGLEGGDKTITSIKTLPLNDDMIDFIDHHLSSRENLKNQDTKKLLHDLRREAFEKPETIVEQGLEPRSFSNKIEFTPRDQQEFIQSLDGFLELHPDNQDAQFTKNLYDFLFKMVREEQLETTFSARSSKEVMNMIDTPEFRKLAGDIKITLVSEGEGSLIIMIPQIHGDGDGVLYDDAQVSQEEIFNVLEILYNRSISNVIMLEGYNNNFDVNTEIESFRDAYLLDIQSDIDFRKMMEELGLDNSIQDRLASKSEENKFFPSSDIFEIKHELNTYSIGIEDESRTRLILSPEALTSEEKKLLTINEMTMKISLIDILIKYDPLLGEQRDEKKFSENIAADLLDRLKNNLTYVGQKFIELIGQYNTGDITESVFISDILSEFMRLDKLQESGMEKLNIMTGPNYSNVRQQVVLDNIDILNDKFDIPKILIFGAGHFNKIEIKEGLKPFEQMCQERNLSCIRIDTKSQQDDFEYEE